MITDELKDRIYELMHDEQRRKKVFLWAAIIVIAIIAIILTFNIFSNGFEKKFIDAAKQYVEKFNIKSNTFISLYDLEKENIYSSVGCNKGTGIYYNNGKYEDYLKCNDFYSDEIKKLTNEGKYISLVGDTFVITKELEFIDPGYVLKNKQYQVEVVNTYTSSPGIYDVTYIVRDSNGKRKEEIKRRVLYSEYNANYEQATITLYGEQMVYVLKNKYYIEPGYLARDRNGENITDNVIVKENINTAIPGTYTIQYNLDQIKTTRRVIVSDIEAKFISEGEEEGKYTKGPIALYLTISGSDYSYTLLPDGKRDESRVITFDVEKNGVYKFYIYDKYNNRLLLEKNIYNIDNEIPFGSCDATLTEGTTTVIVSATDSKSGVASYAYNNGLSTTNYTTTSTYKYDGLFSNVKVKVKDKIGNIAEISCNKKGDGSFAQIKPPSGANIIKSDESSSLKVSIEKRSGYYISRVWVQDPYNQINKGVIAAWGVKRETPFSIISREITNKGLNNKIVLAINASGFYDLNSWRPNSISYNNQYNITTEGPLVITNSQVVRNWYYDAAVDRARNHALYAIDSAGKLVAYPNFNKLTESERKSLFQTIINSGYRNTWVFRPVIFQNGQLVDNNILGTFLNGSSKKTMVCQINTNNFALISTTTGYSIDGIRKILTELGCETAVNMDGGGSVGLLYKSKNGSLETITGGSRAIVDTLYFTEK